LIQEQQKKQSAQQGAAKGQEPTEGGQYKSKNQVDPSAVTVVRAQNLMAQFVPKPAAHKWAAMEQNPDATVADMMDAVSSGGGRGPSA
jgi:hypothetical protein